MNIPTETEEEEVVYIYISLLPPLWKCSKPFPKNSRFRYTEKTMLHQEDYFSLDRFAHKALWQEKDPLWAPLIRLDAYLQNYVFSIGITIPRGVYLEREDLISIGPGTILEPGVMIQGPCVLGSGCVVRHGAYLRGPVLCGDYCAIGHSAEIKNAILLDSAAATHFSYVGDSIIGSFANLGAGVKCANLRLDRKEVSVSFSEEKTKTGLKKLGAIVGDRVQIGCNCVLNPGTLIGKDSVLGPLLDVRGTIPPQSSVSSQNAFKIDSRPLPLAGSFYVS